MASAPIHAYQQVPLGRIYLSREPDRNPSSTDSSMQVENLEEESAVTDPLMKDESLEGGFRTEKRPVPWRANAVLANIILGVVFVDSILVVLCWSLHTYLAHDRHIAASNKPRPRLDETHRSVTGLDIVVSMYKEDYAAVNASLSRILSLSSMPSNNRVFVYTKDEDANVAVLEEHFPAARILQLLNIGREGQTYLHHILSRWDDLARHTLFMQAALDNQTEALHRIDNYYVPETGMLGLSFVSVVCDCHRCSDDAWHDHSGVLAKVYEMANNKTCGWYMPSYKGQFISSAARIRGIGKELYEYLYHAMTEPDSWAHQSEYLGAMTAWGDDSANTPHLGFTLERLWSGIMQCADLEVAARCPTMLSGWRRVKGESEDCQCFDREPVVSKGLIGFN